MNGVIRWVLTKNIKLVVTKIFTDGHTEQTTDYQYDINGTSSNLYLSNAIGSLQNNVTYKGSDNEISVTKTSKGTGSFSVEVHVDELSNTCTLQFDGTNSVNVTLDANNGQFEDGTTTYTYKRDIGGEYISPAVVAPKGYSFVGWYDENDVEMHDHELKSDTTFYAKYKKICKVTFDAGKGQFKDGKKTYITELTEGSYTYVDYPIAPDGYFCTGWYDEKGEKYTYTYKDISSDTTFYAHYEKLYDVTFDAGKGHFEDGTHTYTIQPKYGYPQIYKDVVAPEGYKFIGWFDKNDVEYKEHLFTENTTYYAKYIKLCKVTFDAGNGHFEDGKNTITVNVEEDTYPSYKEPVSPEGMMFIGWFDIDGSSYQKTTIKEDTTFYAKYGKTINVTFDAGIGHFENGDTTYVTKTAAGKEVDSVNPIVQSGYKFAGWYDDDGHKPSNAPYDKDTVFHAKYIKLFKVTYDAGNGHFEDGQNTVTVDVEEDAYPYYKEPVSPEGMMFIGWFDVDGNSYQKTTIKEDTTFYAKYGKTIHVTFDAGKGHFENGDKTKIVKTPEGVRVYGDSVISPDGMLFDGWYDENGNSLYWSDFKKDVTYYARYVKALTITFKANGGIGDTFTATVGEGNYYSSENFDSKFTHPDGKVLIGFQDEETGQFYKLGYGYQFFNDATLLAQWADPVTVTLDCNGGTTSKGSLVQETWAKNTTLSHGSILDEKPVKEGMVFTGWHLDSIDGPKIDPHTIIFDRDTVVYASYSKAVHININLDALGMESKSIEVAKGESVKLRDVCHVSVDEDKEITGYRIDGTNTVIDENQELVFDEDINLTAIVEKKIKLTYDSNGAGFDSVSEYASKDNCHLNNVFNKAPEGKYFAGWAANSPDGIVYTSATSGMPFTEDTTLYAVWKDGVTIHLDLGEGVDGSVQNGNVVKKGSLFRLYDVNVSQNSNGKKLAGWRIDDNPKVLSTDDYFVLNKDITLHAVWEDTITVTIKDPETEDVLYTNEIEKGTYYRDDYKIKKFLPKGKALFGWTLDKDKKDIISQYNLIFDKDVVLYPVYVDNVKITLDWGSEGKGYLTYSKDRVDMNTLESAKGSRIHFNYTILSTPKGKMLTGWKIGDTEDVISANFSNSNYKLYKDTTLHAIWKDTVKITLNANGEKFANNQEIIEEEYIKNNSYYAYSTSSWEGKNLDGTKVITGWRVGSPNGPIMSKKLYNEFDKDNTYYAVWGDLITITFKNRGIKVAEFDNSSTWSLKNIFNRMTGDSQLLSDFDGETFLGWYNIKTGEKLTEDTVFIKDCVFEARTKKGPVKITLDYNGGSGKLNEVTTLGGYFGTYMLNDPYIEAPDNKVFVGWSLEKDGDVLEPDIFYLCYLDKDTTLYAKYEDEVTLTIHDNGNIYTQKVPVNVWMMYTFSDYCEIDGNKYYDGQPLKFIKDADVYLKESSGSSRVALTYRDISKLIGNGIGTTLTNPFIKWVNLSEVVTENPGKEVNLDLDESFIPKGMKFDKWETVGDITIKDPTSKKTSFIMPKNELGKIYEIYATYAPRIPLQLEKDTLELNKGEKNQIKVTGDYETLTWSSSDSSTVEVDQSGHIHALKSGKATITVKDNSGETISCVVTVTNKLNNLTLNEKVLDLKGKIEKKLNVTLTPNDADEEKLTWSSSNEGVVKVSEDGTLTPVSCGEATITVESKSGLIDRCKVVVVHDWKLDSKVDATVDKEGKKVFKCTLCYETKEETIPKLIGKWVTDSHGKWYQYSNGTYEKSGFKQIDNHTYYFQSNGYVQVGWLLLNNDWYMFDSEGVMITGWNGSYFFDENGKMMKNAFTPDHYYVGSSGAYLTNCWFKHDGKDYYADNYGHIVKNKWIESYYLGSDGAMVTNTFTPDGYYCGSDGAYVTNCWIKVNDTDYYMNASGKVTKNAWVGDYYLDSNGYIVKNAWIGAYYLDQDGKYVRNAFTPDGYYCGSDGAYVTNCWVKVNCKYYYMNAAGTVTKNAWVGSYYLGSDGAMLTNTNTPDGYYVGSDGLWTPAKWIQSGNKWWYRHSDGSYTTNDFEEIGNQRYYFDSYGYMVTGWKCISGQWYYFDSNGFYQTGEHFINGEYYYFNNQGIMQTGYAEDGWEYNSSGQRIVYWSSYSTNPVYHRTPHNIKKHNLVRGTYSQAVAAGKTNYCKTC
ncbi:InlB B-repeat-containing protein [Holdemanella porci]|uniref:InlB B-repeat-containing protein n=1 Tax=Holdemanella porci TaxID=2652276 RepID=UPI003F88F85E